MCTLIALLGMVPGFPLVVAMNRDEYYDRPSVPPELRAGTPKVVAPRDERAAGTWIGVNEHGLLAAVSNRFAGPPDPQARSRGLLCLDSLSHKTATDASEFAAKEAETHAYNPFNLLHGDSIRVVCASREGGATFVRDGGPGVNVLTNAGLNAGDPRGLRVLELLQDAAYETLDLTVGSTRRALADHKEAGGRGICHHGEKTGTRSQTIVGVSDAGWRGNRLWYTEGHPCTAPPTDLSPRFQ